jgi:hypothetical protein
MNKQTRHYHKRGLSFKVQKGSSHPNNQHSGYATPQSFEVAKGRAVNSSKERADSGRQPWKGMGDPMGRNK